MLGCSNQFDSVAVVLPVVVILPGRLHRTASDSSGCSSLVAVVTGRSVIRTRPDPSVGMDVPFCVNVSCPICGENTQ